jgi:hypothetical protein
MLMGPCDMFNETNYARFGIGPWTYVGKLALPGWAVHRWCAVPAPIDGGDGMVGRDSGDHDAEG